MKIIIGLASLLAAIALIVILLGPRQTVVAAIDGPVRVQGGLISGITDAKSDVRVFKGIPYAAPPVADLRWKPPAPVKAWTGVRQAAQYSAPCMQPVIPLLPGVAKLEFEEGLRVQALRVKTAFT